MCNCCSLPLFSCRSFEDSLLPEHLSLLFGILANLSKIFFIKLPASDEKETIADLRHFDIYLASLHSILEKLPGTPAQKHPYQMRFKENFALFYQMTAFLLLKLAYDQILDLDEMLQLTAVCLSISFSITPPTASEESAEMLIHTANCRMCVVGYLLAALSKLNGPEWLKNDVKARMNPDGISRIMEVSTLSDDVITDSLLTISMFSGLTVTDSSSACQLHADDNG